MTDSGHDGGSHGGSLKRFALTVLVMFVVIVALVAALALFGSDGGLLEFNYEGA